MIYISIPDEQLGALKLYIQMHQITSDKLLKC